MNEIKVLTLWEPWATLLAYGFKKIETRPGKTTHKGIYLIHAAKKWSRQQDDFFYSACVHDALSSIGITERDHLNYGKIIGACQFSKCRHIVEIQEMIHSTRGERSTYHELTFIDGTKRLISDEEQFFGDYGPGRWIWESINRKILENPIEYKGSQGYYANFTGDYNSLNLIDRPVPKN